MAKYEIQQVKFCEWERNQLSGEPQLSTIFSGTFEECREKYDSYCSGLNDDEAPCDNQNYSVARFYRIVEVSD